MIFSTARACCDNLARFIATPSPSKLVLIQDSSGFLTARSSQSFGIAAERLFVTAWTSTLHLLTKFRPLSPTNEVMLATTAYKSNVPIQSGLVSLFCTCW